MFAQLPSSRPQDNDRNFPAFQFPTIIGEYSTNGNQGFEHNRSQLQVMRPEHEYKNQSLDLDVGFKTRIKRLKPLENIDSILRWIIENKHMKDDIFNADFICFRGLLRYIMNTPYEKSEAWIIRIMKWKDTLFFCRELTEEKRNEVKTEKDERFCYWGYKFEDYLARKRDPEPDSQDLNENEEFCCMFRSKLGQFRLVYGAEMDCYVDRNVQDSCPLRTDKFVEFKTARKPSHPGQLNTLYRFKYLKWWLQSFLVGIPTVIVGWRDDAGIVHEVEDINVRSMPRSARGWQGNVCANFLLEVLKFLNTNIKDNSLDKVYRLSSFPQDGGLKFETEKNGDSFLPAWFTSHFD